MKRLYLSLPFIAVIALIAMPFLGGRAATETRAWSAFSQTDSWEYSQYRVDAVAENSLDLERFGDALVLVKRAGSCEGSCTTRDLSLISDAGYIEVTDVPTASVDEKLIAQNDERLVYSTYTVGVKSSTVSVMEVNLTTGARTTLVDNASIPVTAIDAVTAHVDGELVFVTVNDRLYGYHAYNNSFQKFFDHQTIASENFVAAQNGQVVADIVFPTGEEQLWLYTYVANGPQIAEGLPGTWTGASEDMLAVHFTDKGSLEYFRQFTRNVTSDTAKNNSDPWQTESFKQFYLNWFRTMDKNDLSNLVQVEGSNMAWIDTTDHLYTSDGSTVSFIASIGTRGTFLLGEDMILWGSGWSGGISKLDGTKVASLDFTPTDTYGDIVVGVNTDKEVVYLNLETGEELKLGSGYSAFLSGTQYAYWKGTDGRLYQATIFLPTSIDTTVDEAIKITGSPRVYVHSGNEISFVPNEKIFYTWFDSFNAVRVVTPVELASYTQTKAEAAMKPGTLLTINHGSKVYMVGADGLLHWVVDSATAQSLFGSNWSSQVRSFTSAQTLNYTFGEDLRVSATGFEDLIRIALK